MKKIYFTLFLLVLLAVGCRKNSTCNTVIITQVGTPCSEWAIKILNNTYPSNNIPVAFRQEGITVCAEYDLYEDLGMCACCGGTKATIISMTSD